MKKKIDIFITLSNLKMCSQEDLEEIQKLHEKYIKENYDENLYIHFDKNIMDHECDCGYINPNLFDNMEDNILKEYFEKASNSEIENGIFVCNIFYASLKRFKENKYIIECMKAIDFQKQRRFTDEDLIIENLILDILNTDEKIKEFKEYQKNINDEHIEAMFICYIISVLYERKYNQEYSHKDIKKFYDSI